MPTAERMNADIVQLIETLEYLSAKLPTALTAKLFDTNLFLCRSEHISDYLAEMQQNLASLECLKPGDERYEWLSERCQAQVNAFLQASLRNTRRINQSMRSAEQTSKQRLHFNQNSSNQQHLAAELAKHHDYERRLVDNLRLAQQQPTSPQSQQRVLQCQQRLLRCQRAIADIERKIDALQD